MICFDDVLAFSNKLNTSGLVSHDNFFGKSHLLMKQPLRLESRIIAVAEGGEKGGQAKSLHL